MSKSLNLSSLGPQRIVQMLLGVGGLVLVVGAVVMFLINAQIRDMQATVSSKEALVGTSEQTAQRFQQTQQDYAAISSRAQYLEASVSAKAFVPTLLKQLQGLAATTHLTVTAVRPGVITSPTPPAATSGGDAGGAAAKKDPPTPYDTLDIAVDVAGTYAETASFLYNLTRFPKIISVASVQMHPGGTVAAAGQSAAGQSAAPVLTTNLHLTAFVFHDAAADVAPAGAAAPTAVAAVNPPPPIVPSAPVAPASPSVRAVSATAAHAAGRALGIGKAAQARGEVGIETL